MKKSNRDRQWSSIRRVEFVYGVVAIALIVGLLIYGSVGTPSDVVFLVVSGAAVLIGLGIWVRQYQVLDELGKLRFLKSWMVSGMVTASGIAWALLWGSYQGVVRSRMGGDFEPPNLFWPTYLALGAGMVTMGLTNLYLRRRDQRGE